MNCEVNQTKNSKVHRNRMGFLGNDDTDHNENDHIGDKGGQLPELMHEVLDLGADALGPDSSHQNTQGN